MVKAKVQSRLKQGAGIVHVDADAVQRFWFDLSLQERRQVLRFEDPELVECLFNIWQALCISDMTCYVVGIGSQIAESKRLGNEFFAIEGYISQSVVLHEAAFYGKHSLIERHDFFEIMEYWIGSPLWVGRPMVKRRDWPSLFKGSINSWSKLLHHIFQLIEVALYHAEQASRLQPTETEAGSSKCSKRRAREKKLRAKLNQCPVCEGTGLLLDDPCPLCGDAEEIDAEPAIHTAMLSPDTLDVHADNQEDGHASAEKEERDDDKEYDPTVTPEECEEDEVEECDEDCDEDDDDDAEESLQAFKQRLSEWSSGWRHAGRRCDADGSLILFERPLLIKSNLRAGSLPKIAGALRASVRKTFVHISQDCPATTRRLQTSQSLPCL